jgi:hypothetical protein
MGEVAKFPQSEEWVDAITIANHFKLDVTLVRKMAKARRIPVFVIKNGKREFYRFRISEVEKALKEEKHEDTPGVLPAGSDRPQRTRQRA